MAIFSGLFRRALFGLRPGVSLEWNRWSIALSAIGVHWYPCRAGIGCGCSQGRRNRGRATSVPSGLLEELNASVCQWTFSPTPRAWLWLRGDQTEIGLLEQWPILVGLKHEKSTGCHGNGRLGPVASG